MTIRNTIGSRLYDLRISRGETQEQVANHLPKSINSQLLKTPEK